MADKERVETLFELQDYKLWIRQRIRSLPQGGRGELSRMAQHLGVHVTLVSQILKHDKDFTIEQAHQLTEYFKLNQLESEFFLNLVQINRAGTHGLKTFYKRRMEEIKEKSLDLKVRVQHERQLGLEESSTFYSSWLYSAVRVYTSLGDGRSFEEIQKHFHLSVKDLHQILDFLIQAGLCAQNGAIYTVGTRRTHLSQGSPMLKSHLSNWRLKALETLGELDSNELMYSSCLSLSKKDFEIFRERMAELVSSIQAAVKETNPEDLVIFNLDWLFLKP